jgi:S1-C subfamily serine protease/regulator of sirC expression with transglutaminase-like and TPR domain
MPIGSRNSCSLVTAYSAELGMHCAWSKLRLIIALSSGLLVVPSGARAADMSVAELADKVRDSTVVISVAGRDGERSSLGAGFVIDKNGLIATNLHVIGEARPIFVTLADGRRVEATEIHATDRTMDLAVIRVKASDLKALELGDSDALKQGQEVVAVGNPRGLEHSVVSGVVSAVRIMDGKPMVQLAMPIEQGNSGGPVLDRQGRVEAVVTMKSVVTENLGFAVAINALKPLLKKPNPVRMDQWLTIGAIDGREWAPLMGGRWRQHAGRVVVEGPGVGFGGRALLVSTRAIPTLPYELAVWVRIKNEDGAAGLAFALHDINRHYAFYPSNGRMRLTRFDGADVYSWHILKEVRSSAYRPGEWNRLKVRFEKEMIRGYVNDVLVVEVNDTEFREGKGGLANFRDTHAEFKGFEIADKVPSVVPAPEVVLNVERMVRDIRADRTPDAKVVTNLFPNPETGVRALLDSADRREREAKQLRRAADSLRSLRTQHDLSALFNHKAEKEIDLLRAALIVARMDNDDLDVDAYLREIDGFARTIREALPRKADDRAKLVALDEFLFKKMGFHGCRTEFESRSNSYLNEVIDDREGLPVTLSILYIELARRIGVSVVGIGLPGRYLVRLESVKDNAALIDVYEAARRLSHDEAETQARALSDLPITADSWKPQSKREIVGRLVKNLAASAEEARDAESMLRYIEVMLTLDPSSVLEHWRRAVLCFETGRRSESLSECNWLLAKDPQQLAHITDPHQVQQLKSLVEAEP